MSKKKIEIDSLTLEERITIARKRKGLTLWALAILLGMTAAPLHNRIKGYVAFRPDELKKLAKILQIRVN